MKYSEEQTKCAKQIFDIKTPIEANLIFSLYKQPELILTYDFKSTDFLNKSYRCLFQIIQGMVIDEKTEEVNEISIGMYLEGREVLRVQYDELGGWDTIQAGFEYNVDANFESDYDKNIKYNVLLKLLQNNYPVENKLMELDQNGKTWLDKDIQSIYEEIDAQINNIFIQTVSTMKIEDITDGGDELIEKWNKGNLVGLPFHNFPILTSLTGGLLPQNVTLMCASSNTGKSSLLRSMVIPSLLQYNEPSLTILNEEPREKWLREELVRIANNEFSHKLNKNVVRAGNYTSEVMGWLRESLDWLKEKKKQKLLNFISFPQYSNNQAIKTIKQASNNGVSQIIIDTFKCDNDRASKKLSGWEILKENMVDLANVARERNLHVLATAQLRSSCDKVRYLTRTEIGESTGIIEAASTAILMRRIWDDELPGGKSAISVYRKDGKQDYLVPLDANKNYLILFIDKSREGASKTIQVVAEVDWVYNTLKEIGFTRIPFNG